MKTPIGPKGESMGKSESILSLPRKMFVGCVSRFVGGRLWRPLSSNSRLDGAKAVEAARTAGAARLDPSDTASTSARASNLIKPRSSVEQQIARVVHDLQHEPPGRSAYLDRLRTVAEQARDPLHGLEEEIREEMAGALGRSGNKADLAFAQLEHFAKKMKALLSDRIDRGESAGSMGADVVRQHLDEYEELRKIALSARSDLALQRSAVGFRNESSRLLVAALYPEPPPLTVPSSNASDHSLLSVCNAWLIQLREAASHAEGDNSLNATAASGTSAAEAGFKSEMSRYLSEHGMAQYFPAMHSAIVTNRPADPLSLALAFATAEVERQQRCTSLSTGTAGSSEEMAISGGVDDEELAPLLVFFSGFVELALLQLHEHRPASPRSFLRDLLHQQRELREAEIDASASTTPRTEKKSHPRVLVAFCPHGEATYQKPRGTVLTLQGRQQMYELGAALRQSYGMKMKSHPRPASVSARALRGTECIHSCESLLHGLFDVNPMPTDATRERMPLSYTAGHCSLLYRCNLRHNSSEKGKAAAASGPRSSVGLQDWATIQFFEGSRNGGDNEGGVKGMEKQQAEKEDFWFKSKKDYNAVNIVANCRPATEDILLESGEVLLTRLLARVAGRLKSDRGQSPIYFVDPNRETDSNAWVLLAPSSSSSSPSSPSSSDPSSCSLRLRKQEYGLEEWRPVSSEESESMMMLVPEENPSASLSVHVGTSAALSRFADLLCNGARVTDSGRRRRRRKIRAIDPPTSFGFGPGETAAVVVEIGGNDGNDDKKVFRRTKAEIKDGIGIEEARDERALAVNLHFFSSAALQGGLHPTGGDKLRLSLKELREVVAGLQTHNK